MDMETKQEFDSLAMFIEKGIEDALQIPRIFASFYTA
jgi:hypothetical protein